MSELKMLRLQFTPDWRASALALLLLPLLLSLGFWQLERAEEKRQLESLFAQRQASAALAIEEIWHRADVRYQPVRLQGHYINDKQLLLDNRIYQGQFGYEVITPFLLSSGDKVILVNRGWLAADRSRRSLPGITPIDGPVELIAEVYVPSSEMMLLGDEQSEGWPRIVQSVNVASVAASFEQTLFPYTARLKDFSPGHYQPNWVVVNLQPEKHTAYAVQWFTMSATLLLIAFLANTNFWALIKPSGNNKQ
jgi:cytochrome oxidase assembly protein ShyY1